MTFGEKQQKCYCGAEKCRRFLGASNSNSNTSTYLDHIWDVSDESDDDDDDDESMSEEENSKTRSKQRKKKKNNGDVDVC